ncbi:hemolymph lipopolysaccharide-binding protein-like [Choristoneura fumiferana]|uniref:hemolymph lipopolysaccharide-binding protein-like n=1 Tax=Choristoneura fumiferana TaxID=7141 RepID=UPI003D155BA9
MDSTPLSRIPVWWAPGEPDNANNGEDCLLMLPSGTLADVNCTRVYPYVCYRKKKKNMPALNACGTVDNDYNLDSRTNSCYKFHTTPLIWTRAFVACAREGGYLAIINSELEHQLIRDLYNKSYSSIISGNYNRGAIHLGYKSFEHLSLWMTIHGQTLKEAGFEEWSEGQPNHHDGDQDYVTLLKDDGLLDDTGPNNLLPFICEKDPSSLLAAEDFS